MLTKVQDLWHELYGADYQEQLDELITLLKDRKEEINYLPDDEEWYKKGAVYSTYVDLFADDFSGLTEKLDYLDQLGITAIWLLPILDSPMVDQGFDVSDYYQVREELGTNQEFFKFINAAHERGIKIIFDVPINHSSDQHPWFLDARESENAEYRDYYIWNEDQEKYEDTRLLLKGISNSNWTYNQPTDDYYFHRFYDIQPDLNYKNPEVLIEMIKVFSYWKLQGVDGFRMDAAPFLWKKEGTNCENLKETHQILKIYRAALDYLGAGTAIIAEANQRPEDVVDYLGQGDECHVAYNFPIMPKFYLALAESDPSYLIDELESNADLDVPSNAQWFTFLRCHDELTLEFVTEEERQKMNQYYLKDDKWTFRDGEGISGRLYDLLEEDVDKMLLMYSMLFSIEGTPIIYYGDELGMGNDLEFYKQMNEKTGYVDSRFLNRGPFKEELQAEMENNPQSDSYQIFSGLQEMIEFKNKASQLFTVTPEYKQKGDLFISTRELGVKKLTIYNNLGSEEVIINDIKLEAYQYSWELTIDKSN